jgi:competence protein ComEC
VIGPLFWLALAFLAGILLGDWLGGESWPWLVGMAAAVLLALLLGLLRRRSAPPLAGSISYDPPAIPIYILLPLALAAVCLGAARDRQATPATGPGYIGWYTGLGEEVTMEGRLIRPPDERDRYTNLLVQAERMRTSEEGPWQPVTGQVLASVSPGGGWRYGDRLRLAGEIGFPENVEGSAYPEYLYRHGIGATLAFPFADLLERNQGNPLLALIYSLRQRALSAVYALFPDPEASLLAGILLGVETGIPEDVQQAFRDTGTSHIIAISGFNIAILITLLASWLGRLLGPGRTGARRGALVAVAAIAGYAVLVGGSASVVRAAIMGGMALLAVQLGRRSGGVNGLVVVAALMALFTPFVLWDVGFQLSFAATLGLVLFALPLTHWFERVASTRLPQATVHRLAGPVGEYFLFTLAATLLTLPVLVYHFQRISLISLAANPLVLPVQPALMVLGGLATVAGMIWLPLGKVLAFLAWPLAAYTIRAVEWLAGFPLAAVAVGKIALPLVVIFYLVVLVGVFGRPALRSWLQRRGQAEPLPAWLTAGAKPQSALFFGGLATLALLTVVAWQAALAAPDGRLHLTVLDVGSGEALLIRTPGGRTVLINGGPSPAALSDGLGRRLPLAHRRLDYLVVAGVANSQLAALPSTLERFPPRRVLWAGLPEASRGARGLHNDLIKAGIPIDEADIGQVLDLGDGIELEVVASGKQGAVLLLAWENFRALLPLGLDAESLEALQDDPRLRQVSVLLLADQGAAGANPPEWLARLDPQLVLLSVGVTDSRGLPDPEVIQALEGYNLLRTDQNGWIELTTDGEQMWVEAEK